MRVLIVDDEKRIRIGMRGLVEEYGISPSLVRTAADAESALKMIAEDAPDLVLADINMPGGSGLDMIASLRETNPSITVVIVTGYNSFSYAKRAIELGAAGFLLKPVSREELHGLLSGIEKNLQTEERNVFIRKWFDQELSDNLCIHRRGFLEKLLSGELDQKQLGLSLDALGLSGTKSGWLCISKKPFSRDVIKKQEVRQRSLGGSFISVDADGVSIVLAAGPNWDEAGESGFRAALTADHNQSGTTGPAMVFRKVMLGWEEFPGVVDKLRQELERIDSPIVRAAFNLIGIYYTDPDFSLKRAAEMLQVNPSYLSREFSRKTGQAFVEALNLKRIHSAADDLEKSEPTEKIYEIAERNGFSSQHYFSRLFKNITGISPKQYRRG